MQSMKVVDKRSFRIFVSRSRRDERMLLNIKRPRRLALQFEPYRLCVLAPRLELSAERVKHEHLLRIEHKPVTAFDLIEANEAFAVQAIADGRALGWDWDRVNVNGGAIALGHPIGASGTRVLTTLLYAMCDRKARTGLVTLCLGGGNAVALAVEAL